jgi:site-specific DNA recombinase
VTGKCLLEWSGYLSILWDIRSKEYVTRSWYDRIMSNPPVRAAIYCRISSDRMKDGLGVTRQELDCRELARSLGWDVAEVYIDNDVSAFNRRGKDVNWRRLLNDLREGVHDGLVAWHVDRMYRRPKDLEPLIEIIEKRKIQVRTVTSGPLDLSNPAGVAMAKVSAVFAEYESAQKGVRQRAKARELALAGKGAGGGTRPFGFENDRMTIRESEAELIREATHRVLRNGQSLSGIIREWNQKGIPTTTGKRWNIMILRRMLVSARISGRREYNRTHAIGEITADAIWPGIISHEDSDRLREILTDPARRTTVDNARKYLLSGGLVYCGIEGCGRKLIARAQGDHQRSYVCADIGQAHLRMIAEPLELFVAEAAFDYLDEFVDLAAAVRRSEAPNDAELWDRYDRARTDLERLDEDYYVGRKLTEARYTRLAAQLTQQIDDAQRAIDHARGRSLVANLPTTSAHARKLWTERGLEWRRLLIGALIERVEVGPGVRGRNKFDPNRVKITFRRPMDSVREDRFGPGGIQFVLVDDGGGSDTDGSG